MLLTCRQMLGVVRLSDLVPAGRYVHGFADTITTFGVVVNTGNGPVLTAIDPRGRELYEVSFYDNGPDHPQEGVFRILRNDRIGYADGLGRIEIPPRFDCASPFHKGRPRGPRPQDHPEHEHEHERAESEEWFFIDKRGNRL